MESVEDILETTKILAENPDNVVVGSCFKAEENGDRAFSDAKRDEDGSFADDVVITKRVVVETETVVESTFNSNFGLVNMEKEENGVLSSVLEKNDDVVGGDEKLKKDGEGGGRSFSINMNDVVGSNEKIKIDGEVSCTDNGESGEKNCSEANVDVHGKEQGNINGEKIGVNDVFRVGDFVWGKIKSYPWWPGQIYDSIDASDFAVKHSQEGRLLVAYFGDGSCSWCLPSQLVPFVENFKQMSTDSSSKSVLKAIQSAVNDIGRLLECNMTCKCIPLDKRDGLDRPIVSNAGIKKGVPVPDVDIRRLSVPEYAPSGVRENLMNYAKGVNFDCLLELAVLRSWLSAFYRAKGVGHRLLVYCEPAYIEGLEDKNKTVSAVAGDFSVPIEVPILGPREDVWLSSAAVKSQTSSDDKIYHRRKKKSVAELMGEFDSSVKPKSRKRGKVKEEKDVRKSASARKRRKSDDEEIEGSLKGKTSRKRKVEVSEEVSNAEQSVYGVKKSSLSGKPKEIKVAVGENTSGEAKEELETINTPRERKKSKYLSPPYTDPIWCTGNSSSKMKSKSDKSESDRASDEELPIVHLKALDPSAQTMESDEKMSFSASDVNIQVNELLSEIHFAAVDPLYLSKKGSLDMVWAFVFALRSSTYVDGMDYKIYQKSKTGRKKIKSLKNQENGVAHEKVKSADDTKAPKAVKSEGEKADESKSKKASEYCRAKNSVQKLECNSASTCLILTFSPGFPLPSKEKISKLYGKFGSLNEKETTVLTESHSVRIVYMKESNAEAAFKSSVSESPFGVENVNYWLQHSSAGSKSRPKISLRACENSGSSEQTDVFMSDVRVIRQKLEIMTAIMENYHYKFSTEEKSSLKDEMKHLMENVEMVSERVRVMAEKTSS